ncbi:hypothetical protein K788_0001969 (plasmid) [Paraburkholderia caribensis MBA4]|uniref:Uncharacterized protein n=1 Tax=Paraburkholderia caribensis MBA4 TaxID=1323664 RepID=A0A0P0RQB5_9BURK|nr:hypothetical protein K788_0001969 [Paraburkholderia caribensis MBA4]
MRPDTVQDKSSQQDACAASPSALIHFAYAFRSACCYAIQVEHRTRNAP